VKADYRFAPLAGVGHWVLDQAPVVLAGIALERIGAPPRP
jgi:hypothetical protein